MWRPTCLPTLSQLAANESSAPDAFTRIARKCSRVFTAGSAFMSSLFPTSELQRHRCVWVRVSQVCVGA